MAGNFPGRGGSGGDIGRVGRSGGVLQLLRTRYGRLVTSATVSARALRSVDWEEKERERLLSPLAGVRSGATKNWQRGERGCHRVQLGWLGRTGTASATVNTIFWNFAHRVFGQMPAWIQISSFWKVSLWVVKIFSKVSKYIFVVKKDDVLQKFYFKIWVWWLFQIQTLADVWVGFWFEFLFESS
jgi:hypothetical protein